MEIVLRGGLVIWGVFFYVLCQMRGRESAIWTVGIRGEGVGCFEYLCMRYLTWWINRDSSVLRIGLDLILRSHHHIRAVRSMGPYRRVQTLLRREGLRVIDRWYLRWYHVGR